MKTRALAKLFTACLACAAIHCWAGLDEGYAAIKRKDYATALANFEPLAKQGNAKAQFRMGVLYTLGRGVPQNFQQAAKWYRLAADQGLADAQNNLGSSYFLGEGVTQDFKQAAKWFRLAADQGEAGAQNNLGLLYKRGQGVPQDTGQAMAWYLKAAQQQDADAQNNLGALLLATVNTAKARLAAYALFKLSASNDPSSENKATQNLAKHAATLTPQELEAGQALARELAQSKDMAKTLSPYLDKASAQAVKATAKPTPKPRPAKSKPAAGASSGG